jgi:hypothetical protein
MGFLSCERLTWSYLLEVVYSVLRMEWNVVVTKFTVFLYFCVR